MSEEIVNDSSESESDDFQKHVICGVSVAFPFVPYPCQLDYMEKVIQALQTRQNAILESPTGTGKTLCLLCATLAWRESQLKIKRASMAASGDAASDSWGSKSGVQGVPKIIYSSRTHSQLTQVIRELKRSQYRPRMSIIGSREQLCINPEVTKLEGNAEKVHACRAKVQAHSCGYYNKLQVQRPPNTNEVLDIEELVGVGQSRGVCPYYLARELMKDEVDLIFMPYNYILDAKMRKMHGISVEATIVILDEAHNIEQACEASTSFDLTSSDIAHCVSDADSLLRSRIDEAKMMADKDECLNQDLNDLATLKELFVRVDKALNSLQMEKNELVKPGDFIFQFFGSAGLTDSTYNQYIDQCSKAISLLNSATQSIHKGAAYLQKFLDAIKIVFGLTGVQEASKHFKVYIKQQPATQKRAHSDVWTSSDVSSKKDIRTLSYWCFNPGYAMSSLKLQGVHSIVLTSGTLSPMSSFSSELQLDFPFTLEGSHVISRDQVWVGALSKGCDNYTLNSSYKHRSKPEYLTSLGNTLVNFSRTVPNGMLVFMPSYPVLHTCWDDWTTKGILTRIEQYKSIFKEPKGKTDFKIVMDAFYDKVHDPVSNGAVLFAVCRGKISEGLDFSDINCRAVIITGIPFPPRMDPKVQLKMEYLRDARKRPKSKALDSEDWYKQQASRAVNQAIGRVIRHKNDYGAIILCDERFFLASNQEQLSKWVQPHVINNEKFGVVQRKLIQFFKNATLKYGNGPTGPAMSSISTHHGASSLSSRQRHRTTGRPGMNNKEDDTPMALENVPVASLAKLQQATEEQEKPTCLLDSLTKVEKSTSSDTSSVPAPAAESRSTVGQAPFRHFSLVDIPAVPLEQKRRKIVVKTNRPEDMKIHEFLSKLKETFSKSSFQQFKEAVTKYKEDHDFELFLEVLKQLLSTPSTFGLLQGMSTFIYKEHLPKFSQHYHSCTGKELSIRSAAPTKRRSTDDSQSTQYPKLVKK